MLKSTLRNCLGLLILFLVLSSVQDASGQTKDRIIPFPSWSATSDDDDVTLELVGIKVGDKQIALGDVFRFDENWLKEMKLLVKNVSNKTIVSFGIGGGLLEGVDKELEAHQSFAYGIGWDSRVGPQSRKAFRPGETVELSYSNVDTLSKKVLGKVGEGSFCKLLFMSPDVKFKKGDAGLSPRMRFYGQPNK